MFQVRDPEPEDFPGLFDPRVMERLVGEGNNKKILMLLQIHGELLADIEVFLAPDVNLLGLEPELMSEEEFQQKLAIQKGEVLVISN